MDLELREALIAKIEKIGLPEEIRQIPTVSIEDFFEGNDDIGSIGCNLLNHPGVPRFYEIFRNIKARADVADVLVGIYEIEEYEEPLWPFSESVFIITKKPEREIWTWVEELQVDDVFPIKKRMLKPVPKIPFGYKLQQLWWD
jgi:hypothetical protein